MVYLYHPPFKQFYSSALYWLDPTLAAGPIFNLPYNGGIFFNAYHNKADNYRSLSHSLDATVSVKPYATDHTCIPAKVIGVPASDSDIYTLQLHTTKQIISISYSRILAYNPEATPSDVLKDRDKSMPTWIKLNAPTTIFTDGMPKLYQGTLILHQENSWYFYAGRGKNRAPFNLPDLHQYIMNIMNISQLVQGHSPFHTIFNAHRQVSFEKSVACHILATDLNKIDTPTPLNMHHLSLTNQHRIGDAMKKTAD